ncbi:hypothetical protein OEZ85_003799 [Tetradesmus obliquus]|uniref:DNA mismatch repair proteins mutS family domain-containing protein n=1 Tax=Tetradesmus obliquus TaxID=3088 RepID=A0ABY8UCF5_TETOB|nr:hypothetical protein OEZ85_003799 [Tetradesmus obliquus]
MTCVPCAPAGSPGYDPSTLLIPPAALASMSEFMRQFWGLKARAMDIVLFVRHGSFYNLFDVDADVGLRIGLNLSGPPAANFWKVGCHKDYFATWCAKVLAQGYSVGRVEEMPAAAGRARGGRLLERRLVRIYSPGTAVEGLLADDLDHRVQPILCIVELPINSSSDTTNQPQHQQQQRKAGHSIPLTVVSAIEERLDVVDTFLAHPAPAATLQQHLAGLPDADRLLPKAAAALRALQQQQQPEQQQGGHMQLQQQQPLFDPNDTCAVEAKRAAWKALIALPACLMGFVEAVALMNRQLSQQGVATKKLPLLHKAALAAAKAAIPAQRIFQSAAGGSGGCVVPNDVQLGGDRPTAMLLTGANMGGKSTLLRAVCLAVIMAQCGCHVPAAACCLSPVDATYTRLGASDAIMCGHSTFMVEMSETAACLAAATPASLIVLDELGRGTSAHDGYAIAFAVLQRLACPEQQQQMQMQHMRQDHAWPSSSSSSSAARPRLLFATHYHRLNSEPELKGHVQCCHMATAYDKACGRLVHLYKLKPGAAPAGSSGIEVAALAGLPQSLVHRAAAVAAAMEAQYEHPPVRHV